MFLHYNNGEKEKLIKDILCIQIIDGNTPAIITLKSGGELRIRLDRIEIIFDNGLVLAVGLRGQRLIGSITRKDIPQKIVGGRARKNRLQTEVPLYLSRCMESIIV